MSLLDNAMEKCALMDKTTVSDGRSGYVPTWSRGAEFSAAITYDSSIEARVAEAQGVKNIYTVTTRKSMVLEYHDVFMRLSDSKLFRVTSDGNDNKTPESSNLNMRQVTAEEWQIPRG